MGVFQTFLNGIITGYESLTNSLPDKYASLLNVFIFAILISFYAIFTWKFYRYLSKKDLISLNLNRYNRTKHPFLNKFLAVIFYLVEYIIILPIWIFIWFAVLSLLILTLSETTQSLNSIIILSAAMVGAIRILSYYEEDLSKDLAKIFPFSLLTLFLLNPQFFSLDRVIRQLGMIPELFSEIIYFLILIISLELILRMIDLLINLGNKGSTDLLKDEETIQQQQE
ncbi:hypothetical protein CXT76_02360 [Candidatus Parvarchaeota archaeon]|jgi:hypothetical protein|nr:MAG: hypothetical protein CXT76_02360 [Candidatus Parvarchaeota archaeon]